MMRYDLVISGVGGQGTVLASRILATAAVRSGLDGRTAETIGMAQREGCVLSHVRIGDNPAGPLISKGHADGLISFEPAEAVRAFPFLREEARLVVNTRPVYPVTVALGQASYDRDGVLDILRRRGASLVDAGAVAAGLGSLRCTNVVMLGAASGAGMLPLGRQFVLEALKELVPEKHVTMNLKAFEAGESLTRK